MAATNSLAGLVTVVRKMHFGGSSTKARKRFVISFTDATNGIAVGGETNKLNVADLGLGMTFVDNCSSLLAYTTSTKATTQVIAAAPSADGSHINTSLFAAGSGAAVDAALATTETGQITIEGY